MNKGIRRSVGSHCIFLNAGDEFAAPDTLASVAPFLCESNDIVYGDAIEAFENDEAYKAAFSARRHWYSMFTHHQAIFYRREAIASGYDVKFRLAADWALTSSLIMNGAKAVYVPKPICRFQRGGSSDNRKLRDIANKELWRVYREVHGHGLSTALALYTLKRAANVLRHSAKPIYKQLRMRSVSPMKGKG
jgi:putative colanic acid biosynthesis glycosyltransferase